MKTGIELIAAERERQITAEGYTAEHDDRHKGFEIALAGSCYAIAAAAIAMGHGPESVREQILLGNWNASWPFGAESLKMANDPVQILAKAGALIAAEIDRLQRASDSPHGENTEPFQAAPKDAACSTITERETGACSRNQSEYTYASKQQTVCAGCGRLKHTPLRRDEMGGYVCLTCIDKRLDQIDGDVLRDSENPASDESPPSEPQPEQETHRRYKNPRAIDYLNAKPRGLNISEWLRKNEGDNWKYDGRGTWWCDDGVRFVSRVALDCMDEGGPVGYHLYGGDNPGWVHFHANTDLARLMMSPWRIQNPASV